LKRVLFIFPEISRKANKNKNKMKKQIIYSNDEKLRKTFEIHFWQQDVFCFLKGIFDINRFVIQKDEKYEKISITKSETRSEHFSFELGTGFKFITI
jgi:hypothetical protein